MIMGLLEVSVSKRKVKSLTRCEEGNMEEITSRELGSGEKKCSES